MSESERALLIGDVLHGFCGGAFGRDSYDCRRVEAIGADWIVTRSLTRGSPEFTRGPEIHRNLAKYRMDFTFCSHDDEE